MIIKYGLLKLLSCFGFVFFCTAMQGSEVDFMTMLYTWKAEGL